MTTPKTAPRIRLDHPRRPDEADYEYADMQRRISQMGGPQVVVGILQMYALANPIQGSFAGSLWAIAEWVNELLEPRAAPAQCDAGTDTLTVALEPFRNLQDQTWDDLFRVIDRSSIGFARKWNERLTGLRTALAPHKDAGTKAVFSCPHCPGFSVWCGHADCPYSLPSTNLGCDK